MTTAREITHMGAACIWENDTLAAAAQKMRDLGVGSLPICGRTIACMASSPTATSL
jgi:CBS domain-containing protein